MCYMTFLATTSDEDLGPYGAGEITFVRPEADYLQPGMAALNLPHTWHVCWMGSCSCGLRHATSAELGFGPPEDWYPEEESDLANTAVLYRAIESLVRSGHQVECLDWWVDTPPEDVRAMDVDLADVPVEALRLFEGYVFRLCDRRVPAVDQDRSVGAPPAAEGPLATRSLARVRPPVAQVRGVRAANRRAGETRSRRLQEDDMGKRALVVWGGWDGHEPEPVARIFERTLIGEGFAVDVVNTLEPFADVERVRTFDLVVPVWTMGSLTGEQQNGVCEAVRSGVGIAGCHGGMCDSFRDATEWQFMTGGQWVAHPGNDGVEYTVRITQPDDPLVEDIGDFVVRSEQYYLHTDPSNRVLAVTRFPVADGPHAPNGPFDMPVVWTRLYGLGRVYYCSLGHNAAVAAQPEVRELMRRGFVWAAR